METLRVLGVAYDAVLHGDPSGGASPAHLRKVHMTEVEAELDAVSERYSALHDRLEERKKEIEDSVARVSAFLKQMQELILCLDEKVSVQLPDEAAPADADAARQALEAQERAVQSLRQLGPALEDLRDRAAALQRGRDLAPGVAELREPLGDAERRWAALVAVADERRADLAQLVKDLDAYASVRDALRAGLAQRERLIGVLGPLVAAPSLVTTQLQQARVLHDDVEALRPEAGRLRALADAVAARSEPAGTTRREEAAQAQAQLDRLADGLRQREEALAGLMGPSAAFYELVNRLGDALPALLDRADADEPIDRLADRLDAVEDELRERRNELDRAGELGRQLGASTADPALQFDLKSKVAGLERAAREVQAKVDARRRQLDRGREETARFAARLDGLDAWIDAHRAAGRSPSATGYAPGQLQDARRALEENLSDLHGRQAELADLERSAAQLRESVPDSVRARNAGPRLAHARQELEGLETRLTARYHQLVDVSEQARRFHDARSRLAAWLALEEEKLAEADAGSADRDQVQRSLQDVEHLLREAQARRLDAGELRTLGEELVGAGETDSEEVRAAVDGTDARLRALTDAAAELQRQLQRRLRQVAAAADRQTAAEAALGRCEERWEALRRQPPSDEAGRDLDRLDALLDELALCAPQIGAAEAAARDVAGLPADAAGDQARPGRSDLGEDAAALVERARGLQARADKLREGADAWRGRLRAGEELADQSRNRADALEMRQAELEAEAGAMSPAAVEADALRAQVKEADRLNEKLRECGASVDSLAAEAERLRERGFPAPAARVDQRVRQLRSQHERAAKKAQDTGERARRALDDVERFNKMEAELLRGLETAANKGVVAADGKRKGLAGKLGLKGGKDELKKFQQKHVEPLSADLERLNAFGTEILSRLPPGVNARKMEHDLDKVNKKMADLKESVARQEHSLLDSQGLTERFDPEFKAMSDWIQETEEVQAQQKPPSADYQLIKAQGDEQRLLLKMAKDKQSALETLNDLGMKVMDGQSDEEAGHTRGDLSDLNRRFMMVLAAINNRQARLEQAGRLAKDFRDQKDDVLAWIDSAEQRASALEFAATDPSKIQRQIDEHKESVAKLNERQTELRRLDRLAKELSGMVGESDAKALSEEMDKVRARFETLTAKLEDKLRELYRAGEELGRFYEERNEISKWLCVIDNTVDESKLGFEDNPTDRRVVHEIRKINKEIDKKKSAVDNLTSIGKHLMKSGSKEDSEGLQEKLSNIRQYYDELHRKGLHRQAQLESALQPSEEFVRAHKKLEKILPRLEASLRSHRLNAVESEKEVERLENDLAEADPFIEQLKKNGAELKKILQDDEMGLKISDILDSDLSRYEQVAEEIGRKASQFGSSRQRKTQVQVALNAAAAWLEAKGREVKEAKERLSADPPALDKLKEDKEAFDKNWRERRLEMEETMQDARKLLRETSFREQSPLKDALDKVKLHMGALDSLADEWADALNQALPLARDFADASQRLTAWMEQTEKSVSEADLLNVGAERVRQIQTDTKALEEQLEDHKPVVEQMNKTGTALVQLLKPSEGHQLQEKMDENNARYAQLRRSLRGRLFDIDKVLSQTTELVDQLDALGDNIAATEDQLKRAEPISAHPDKLKSQLAENKGLLEDLEQRRRLVKDIKDTADDLAHEAAGVEDRKEAENDEDNKKEKCDQMRTRAEELLQQCAQVEQAAGARERQLAAAAALAGPFWRDSQAARARLRDLRAEQTGAEPPACESAALAEQVELHEQLGEELEKARADVDACQRAGASLAEAVDSSERGDVSQAMEEAERAMAEARRRWDERQAALEQQTKRAAAFEQQMGEFRTWEAAQEERLAEMGPVAMESTRVKRQLDEVKRLKAALEPRQMDVEALNQAGCELARGASPDQKGAVEDRLFELNERWDGLLDSVNERQHKIQTNLLNLGEFQAAFDEVLTWIDKTDRALDDVRITAGDPKAIEMEMAKHKRYTSAIDMCRSVVTYMQRELKKMLQGDLSANRDSVQNVQSRGKELLRDQPEDSPPEHTREQLENLTTKWEALLVKARDRQSELDDALREALTFHGELQEVLSQINEAESALATTQPLGGLPESAREQLRRFETLSESIERLRPGVTRLRSTGEDLLSRANESAGYRLEKDMVTLQQRWDSVQARSSERRDKLQRTATDVERFHTDLNKFIAWLTQAERSLNQQRPVSRVMATLNAQVSEHSALKRDITARREEVVALDRTGTHLRYFSQKQDVIIIKNLLSSVHHRWERVISRSSERTRHLDFGYRDARKLLDMWTALTQWLHAQQDELDAAGSVGNDPATIKAQIAAHRDWQRSLGAKQAAYDATRRFARYVCERAPRPDHPELARLATELKALWNAVCTRSVERQRLLEEALLQSGQYKDALAALVDWLHRAEPDLIPRKPCRGDADTVASLMEAHREFRHELDRRDESVRFVGESAQQLLLRSDEDGSAIEAQLNDLRELWERICEHTNERGAALAEAERLATVFGEGSRGLMEDFAADEARLRALGRAPADGEDEEAALRRNIVEQEAFHPKLEARKEEVQRVVAVGEEILSDAHPDGVKPVRQWIGTLQARYNELLSWSKQRAGTLRASLEDLLKRKALHDDLMAFLKRTDDDLRAKEDEQLPTDMEPLQALMREHDELEKGITDRQPDHDRIIRHARRKPAAAPSQLQQPRIRQRARPHAKDVARHRPRTPEPEFVDADVSLLNNRWRHVWLQTMERRKRIQDAIDYLNEVERMKNFDFEKWRLRYLQWIHHNKALLMDFFRKKDKDHDGRITRQEFIDGILESKFPTSRLEMEAVADIFDRDGDGFIDYKEFVSALRPPERRPPSAGPNAAKLTDSEKIHDEVQRLVSQCTCRRPYLIEKVGEGKYRFGDSQKLRLVRVLRSTVMVRVGGGWVSLDEFLLKNDPCRAKGRTTELRERFILAEGVAQSMATFKSKAPVAAAARVEPPQTASGLYQPHKSFHVHTGCVGEASPKAARRGPSPSCHLHPPGGHGGLSGPPSRHSSRPPSIGSEHEVGAAAVPPVPGAGGDSRIPVAQPSALAAPRRPASTSSASSSIPVPTGIRPPTQIASPRLRRKPRQ